MFRVIPKHIKAFCGYCQCLPVFRVGSIEEVGTYPMKNIHLNRAITVKATESGISNRANILAFFIYTSENKNGTLRDCFSASL